MMKANGVTRSLLSSPTLPLNIARNNATAHNTAYKDAVTVEALEANLDKLILSPQIVVRGGGEGSKTEGRRPKQNEYEGESLEDICGKKSLNRGEAEATMKMMSLIVDENSNGGSGGGPASGGCRAAFPFTAAESWQISIAENEQNIIVLEKHGDGWTKIRLTNGSEGCVPADFLCE